MFFFELALCRPVLEAKLVNLLEDVLKPAAPTAPTKRRSGGGAGEEPGHSRRKKDHGTPTPPKTAEIENKDKSEKKDKKKDKSEKKSKKHRKE